jgi:hypothetical protein
MLEDIPILHNTLSPYGDKSLSSMELKKMELLKEKSSREEQVKRYAVRITALWEQLNISEQEREEFFSKNTGLGPEVMIAVSDFTFYYIYALYI